MEDINLIKDDEVSARLEQRHILDEDIEVVIKDAEEKGEKLYMLGHERYLAKQWLSDAMFYVEYTVSDQGYVVHSAYTHRSQFTEDE
jgi:glutamate synthase (NADPH) small chain